MVSSPNPDSKAARTNPRVLNESSTTRTRGMKPTGREELMVLGINARNRAQLIASAKISRESRAWKQSPPVPKGRTRHRPHRDPQRVPVEAPLYSEVGGYALDRMVGPARNAGARG